MKKSPLFPLMGFLPLVMGFFYIRTAAFPLLGTLFFTALPWVMVALWLRAGWRCGAAGRGWLRSAIVAHWSVLPSSLSISSDWSPGSSGWSCL